MNGPSSSPGSSGRSFADRFELKSQAGTGGMGTVYQALDRQSGQIVAVKILHGKSVTDAARFDQEARLLAELRHPGIVRYVDHGITAHGESYIAMEWLSGETLEERLTRGPLPPVAVARLGRRVLEALHAAHERGIVHRDIKPSNIFLIDWLLDEIRLLDFGIARRVFDAKRFTKAGSTVGTPMYTAPEQARGDRDVDGRTDIFSLGSVLFECLTGEPPFTGESPMEVMAKICIGVPARFAGRCNGLPPEFETLVETMLAQDRRKRPPDAGQLAATFARLARDLAGPDEISARHVATPPPRSTLSDGEQRVMCALVISARAGARPTENARVAGARRSTLPWLTETAVVMPSALALNDTGEVERAVEPFGGHVDRLLDRSLIITLPSRGLLPEQAVQIARCAMALQKRLPTAVLGVATGRATLLARLPVGALVDRLAGLVEGQRAGIIRIDDTTARLLPAEFKVEGTRERRLMGEAVPVDRPREVAGKVGPFVGRDRELTALLSLYREAADERVARAALVLGVAGAGKSRLRQELARAMEAEMVTAGMARPLMVRASGEMLRSRERYPLLGKILAAADIDLDRSSDAVSIQEAFVEWLRLRCTSSPVMLVLEDMQWADLASVQLLDGALRNLKDQPLFVLGLGRPEVDEQFPGLWGERSVERVRLPSLGRKAGQTLLRTFISGPIPEVEAFILDRWEGNPFFLEELVDVVTAGRPFVPETVLGLVEARFDEIPAEARRVLRASAVFGDEPFSSDGVVALLGEKARHDTVECLELLTAEGTLERCLSNGEDAFRFKNRLVREASYRLLPPGDRALARRLARAWLENLGRTLPESLSVPLSQSAVAAVAS